MAHRNVHSALAAHLPMRPGGVRAVVVPIPALLVVAGMTDQEIIIERGLLLGLLILLISLLIVG